MERSAIRGTVNARALCPAFRSASCGLRFWLIYNASGLNLAAKNALHSAAVPLFHSSTGTSHLSSPLRSTVGFITGSSISTCPKIGHHRYLSDFMTILLRQPADGPFLGLRSELIVSRTAPSPGWSAAQSGSGMDAPSLLPPWVTGANRPFRSRIPLRSMRATATASRTIARCRTASAPHKWGGRGCTGRRWGFLPSRAAARSFPPA
jgi:hypothetical protein